jgi:hypothetical protein
MARITERYISNHFGEIWPAHVAMFSRYLIECRKYFRGDLDLLLLLAVIGDRTLVAGKIDPSITYPDLLAGNHLKFQPEPINYHSIAEFTGIPRESVRRKIQHLIDIGWVERTKEGSLLATKKSKRELEPLTRATFEYLARMAEILKANQSR